MFVVCYVLCVVCVTCFVALHFGFVLFCFVSCFLCVCVFLFVLLRAVVDSCRICMCICFERVCVYVCVYLCSWLLAMAVLGFGLSPLLSLSCVLCFWLL